MKAGVRNSFTGTIVDIKQGEIMSEVVVKVGDAEVTSVMTTDSLREVGFRMGDTATALVKAINVVLLK